MKRLINPTRRQKTFLAEHGLKAENWKIEKETPEYLYIVSKNGQHRLLNKKLKIAIDYGTGGISLTQKELQEYRKIMRNAESIEYQIQKLQSQINKVTAIVNDMPRGGESTDKSELICKLIDLQEQYKTEYSTAAEKLKTIETAIAKLSDPQEQAVLRYKYILGLNENKICLKMHYEKSRIYQRQRSALKKIEEI